MQFNRNVRKSVNISAVSIFFFRLVQDFLKVFDSRGNQHFSPNSHSDRIDFAKLHKVPLLRDNRYKSPVIILCVTTGIEGPFGKGRWPHDATIQLHVMPLNNCKPHNNPQ